MLTKIAIFIDELRHLLLQPIILFHQQLVHSSQLPIDSLEPRRLLSLQTKQQPTKDTSCESAVTSGQQHNLTTQHPPRDASPAGLVGLSLLAPILSLWSETTWLCINGLWNYVLFFFPGFCPLQKRL